jgi:hypothetical protein
VFGAAHHPNRYLRQAKGGGVRRDDDVALGHHHQAAAQGMAVDGADHRHRVAADGIEYLADDAGALQRRFGVHRAEFPNVASGHEGAVTGAGQDDAADVGVVLGGAQCRQQLAVDGQRHRIDRRMVDRDQQDMRVSVRAGASNPVWFHRCRLVMGWVRSLLHGTLPEDSGSIRSLWSNH